MEKKGKKQEADVAEKNYEPTDYTSKSELSQALAKTHEQVSDTWTEGTIEYKKERDER